MHMYESLLRNQNITFWNTFHILEESSEWAFLPPLQGGGGLKISPHILMNY